MAKSGVLGYPRIGENREWKKALEDHWAGKLDEQELDLQLTGIRLQHLRKIKESGADFIPVGDFSYYDHVLDTAVMFGIVPKRFASYQGGAVSRAIYYGMARGTKDATACEMTKWFNTNYHYIVPELEGAEPQLTENKPLLAYREAKAELGIEGRPVLLGPLTFLKLSKGYAEQGLDAWLDRLLPLYAQIVQELEREGVQWVQLDEPILVTKTDEADVQRLHKICAALTAAAPGLKLLLQTYFESAEAYSALIELPVHGIGLDFVHGLEGNLAAVREYGFPADKVLGAGVIDGRGIWKAALLDKKALLDELSAFVQPEQLIAQTSCSLLHVPVSLQKETGLAPELHAALAFADEKLAELALLTRALGGDGETDAELAAYDEAVQALNRSASRSRQDIRTAAAAIAAQEPQRNKPFAERNAIQRAKWQLPLFPTTTIGSFPQSAEVRKARQLWRRGEWNAEQYNGFIREQIDRWVQIQEEIGIDVLVHGEFERTDMVEFFGEKLAGFVFTKNGWVQSYGSRCVKPPIIYGDVAFEGPMTVEETRYAQSLTQRPVKGMLTGPITIMNWSFVREDISREQIAYQLAYALRQEVEALEAAGIGMIQVDEPAVREGLPLKASKQANYLEWAVRAFRLATCTVRDETQIHTHMCYCEFHDMIDSIDAMDADVISIETSRSHGELIGSFEVNTYGKGIGLGVYDIHSPRVPELNEMTGMIDRALAALAPELFWINPDCGLKTRGYQETVASLQRMVEAAHLAREKYKQVLV
ncbi:5-methyltetrahydropteroyltriglutamate--homocysteine S-methyltransferase [Paenibacillus athensensis]|uniref:5-methyltetrahydropteroyltriglutamate--homocysteine methyltransferase n=1 Tax=Paenibacillus athensensis TaxID=1967502 RepID=A0A4Y8PX25_9BACL|nr:5-methyltetrahydropteroyltriglutamate--homocysteine S-methyltransferase [Paenibacillus athensensis]MCD1258072.1 5-methyltetrahydropteroyltriglutamate--homocysteine S-methyltransferase [Paenibacillus athensensis]